MTQENKLAQEFLVGIQAKRNSSPTNKSTQNSSWQAILDKRYTHVLWVNETGIHSTVQWKLLE